MQAENKIEKFIKYEPYYHVLFWLIVLSFPYIKYLGKEGGYPNSLLHELNVLFFQMVFSYFIYFVVLKEMVKRKTIAIIVVSVLCAYSHEFFDSFFHDENFQNYTWKQIVSHLISYASFGIVFFALHSSKETYQKQHQLLLLHQEKQIANMAALKAQVTPHFLFNTLNSIYRKTLKKDEESANLILMLSDNIRYFLQKGQNEKVLLKDEIEHIENYIQLQQHRWKNKIEVHFFKDQNIENIEVVPLLFIPFVENAFKYTSQLRGIGHVIEVRFLCKNGELIFVCKNPFFETTHTIEKEEGIGIVNVRRRLQLSYPERHQLEVNSENGLFMVKLKLTTC